MSYLGQNSKSSILVNQQQSALRKISQFIAHIHNMILPRANAKGVYRDLSDDEDYLLTNLQQNSLLHSILAGCMAIDSCISNVFEQQRLLTYKIIKNTTSLLTNFGNLQELLVNPDNQVNKIQQSVRLYSDTLKTLTEGLFLLPFAGQCQQIQGNCEIWFEKNTKSLNGNKKTQITEQLVYTNSKLKKQLEKAQKKIINLQSKIQNLDQYTHNHKNNDLQILEGQVNAHKNIIQNMKRQYTRQKSHLNRQIYKLQQQLRVVQKYSDVNLILLIQQLEQEIDQLKAQRRHDERIINNIQYKIQNLSISKHGKFSRIFNNDNNDDMINRNNNNIYPMRKSFLSHERQPMRNVRPQKVMNRQTFQTDIFKNVPMRKSIVKDQQPTEQQDNNNKLLRQRSAQSKYQTMKFQQLHSNETFMPRESVSRPRTPTYGQYKQQRDNRKNMFREINASNGHKNQPNNNNIVPTLKIPTPNLQ